MTPASAVEAARVPKLPLSVLVVIHDAELNVLLLERAGQPGYWQSVTGSLDAADEPLAQAAAREVAEETGLVAGGGLRDWHLVNEYEIYPTWRHRYADGVWKNVEHVFSLQVPHAAPVRLAAREHRAWLWLPWRDAAAKCFSESNAQAIEQLPRRVGGAAGAWR